MRLLVTNGRRRRVQHHHGSCVSSAAVKAQRPSRHDQSAAVPLPVCLILQSETEAAMSALREEAVGLREALEAQRSQVERHYAGLHAKMRKEYEQVG